MLSSKDSLLNLCRLGFFLVRLSSTSHHYIAIVTKKFSTEYSYRKNTNIRFHFFAILSVFNETPFRMSKQLLQNIACCCVNLLTSKLFEKHMKRTLSIYFYSTKDGYKLDYIAGPKSCYKVI